MTLAIVVSGLVGVMVMMLTFFMYRSLHTPKDQDDFLARLEDVRSSEIESDLEEKQKIEGNGWVQYWYRLFVNTGRITDNPATPARLALIIVFLAFGVGALVWPGDLFGGLAFIALGLFALRGFFITEAGRRRRSLEKQLPNMLSGLRANLQANQTPQQALIAVADDIPSPLGDELRLLKTDLDLNTPITVALRRFADRVPSREIKFLVASIEIAVDSGADLDPQLQTIQKIVDQRTRMRQKLASAVAQAQPAMFVSGFIIPAGFIFSFYSSEQNRDYWTSFFGLITGGVIILLYVAGLFISKKLVDGVANT